jgi:hypothetical protein
MGNFQVQRSEFYLTYLRNLTVLLQSSHLKNYVA